MNREIHIGHLLQEDLDGKYYCALLALLRHENKDNIIQELIKENLNEDNTKNLDSFIKKTNKKIKKAS